MTKEEKYFDEQLQEKLGDYEVKPPAYVWERIAEVQQQQKRKKLFFYVKMSGIAAAILLAFLFGWQIDNQLDLKEMKQPVVQTDETLNSTDEGMNNAEELAAVQEKEEELTGSEEIDDEIVRSVKNEETIENKQFAFKTTTQDKPSDNNRDIKSFSLLEAFQIPRLATNNDKATLQSMANNRFGKSSGLTAEDLATIKRNELLLAMNEAKEDDETNNWQIAAMVAPNYSFNQTNYESSYASNMSVPGAKENLNLGGGLAVEYKAGKRLSIQSGFYYSQLEQSSSNGRAGEHQYSYLEASSPSSGYLDTGDSRKVLNSVAVNLESNQVLLNASAGVVEVDQLPSEAVIANNLEAKETNSAVLVSSADFQQNFEYVEIPVNLRYKVIDRTFDVSLLGGLSTNFLIGNNVYLTSDEGDQRIGETRNMNRVNYSTTIGIGLGYGLTDRLSMRLEPQLKYFLGSLNNSSEVEFKPYSIGIYTGLSYRF